MSRTSSLTLSLAWRHLVARPGYVAAVVLTLALGIGSATAMFSAVTAVLLTSNGVGEVDRVVVGWGVDTRRSSSLIELTYNDVAAMGAASPALSATAAVGASTWTNTLEDPGEPTRVETAGISGPFFELLQVRPGRVVGVVADVPYRGLDQPSLDVYDPAAQSSMLAQDLIVRSDGPALDSAAMVVGAIRAMRPDVVVHYVQSLDAILARATAPWRFAAWVFAVFGGAAFVLALVGLASVVSLDVAQRRHEFAIRLALGAPAVDIARRAVSTSAVRVTIGLALGLIASSGAVLALRGLLFGVPVFDWVTYSAVPILVLAIAAVAAAVPVYGALRTNPAGVLRAG